MSETSEIAEAFKWLKEAGKVKKEKNKEQSTELLDKHCIYYESKNDGLHLIINHNERIVDFWPSTGSFRFRNGRSGRGVFRLLKILGIKTQEG